MKYKFFVLILAFSASSASFAFLDFFDSKEERLEKCGYEQTTIFGTKFFGPKKGSVLAKTLINSLENATAATPSYSSRFDAARFQNNTPHNIFGIRLGYYSDNKLLAVFDLGSSSNLLDRGGNNAGKYSVFFKIDDFDISNVDNNLTFRIHTIFLRPNELYEIVKDKDTCI